MERVLDMKVYRNGEQVTAGSTRPGERESGAESTNLKRETKRERERKRAQALREAKAKARAKAEAAFASFNAPSIASSSSTYSQDETSDQEKSKETEIKGLMSLAEVEPESVTTNKKNATNPNNPHTDLTEKLTDSPITSNNSTMKILDPIENIPTVAGTQEPVVVVPATNTDSNQDRALDRTPESCADESCNNSEPDERPSSPVNVTYYLVKWRSLAYEDATWELAQDVDLAKVKEFLKWQNPPKSAPVPRDSNYKASSLYRYPLHCATE